MKLKKLNFIHKLFQVKKYKSKEYGSNLTYEKVEG
jgi:hypothetical protein